MSDYDYDHLKSISEETLHNFATIASIAEEKLSDGPSSGQNALIPSNTFNRGKELVDAARHMSAISSANMSGYRDLAGEPAICRVQAIDGKGERRTYYIARTSTVSLGNGHTMASYFSPIGRLASLSVGDEVKLQIGGKQMQFELVEKVRYQPLRANGAWDSLNTVFEGEDYGPVTVESLVALLRGAGVEEDDVEALLAALMEGAPTDNVLEGLRHEVRRSMALRDQPILDKFQDEIFRLPIDSQLLILGPPGTGKTTTLIRRLGQKLDNEGLSSSEKSLLNKIAQPAENHKDSWVMFTPTDLLKHFVKEAFNREQVPASDARIKTWEVQRSELARNALGILQSSTTKGKFILKSGNQHLQPEVEQDPRAWFDTFRGFHQQRIFEQLEQGLKILEPLRSVAGDALVNKLAEIIGRADSSSLISVYRALDSLEAELIPVVKKLKEDSDKKIKQGLVKSMRQNQGFVAELAGFLDSLQDEEETDEDEEFDEDTTEETEQQATSSQKAIRVYNRTIQTLARSKFQKRSVRKKSTAAKVREWLGPDRLPSDEELIAIGEGIATQNGLRRFVNASKRIFTDVPSSYRQFRRDALKAGSWYADVPKVRQVDPMELDAIVLLMLRMVRNLVEQRHIAGKLADPRYELLRNIADCLYTQVLVDEATDFSPIQLACMEALARPETGSFFACGDFNQRITRWGTRTHDQAQWAVKGMDTRTIATVYRQSQRLNEFSTELIECLGGDLDARGELPKHLKHPGVSPALQEGTADLEDVAIWLMERIQEVEKIVNIGQLPTIAVLVNTEEQVKPMADALSHLLEDINLRAVACMEGQSLGVGSDVRVFNVEHIKGLEFEAVFFVGVDALAEQLPDLFGKYLYVGATRAATYLGMTCNDTLPEPIGAMHDSFVSSWAG